jgi:hypothetical protein
MKCPRCGEPEHPDQCTVPAQDGGLRLVEWTCFHCDEVFTDSSAAEKHFGTRIFDPAVCVIDAGEVSELRADRDYASKQLKEITRQRDELRGRVHELRSKYEPETIND